MSAPGGSHFKLTLGASFRPTGGETESDEDTDVDGDARLTPLSSLLSNAEDGGNASRTTGSLKSTMKGPEEPNESGAGPVRCVR